MALQNALYDQISNRSGSIDALRNFRIANTKRVAGSAFGAAIDTTYMYDVVTANGGTASVPTTGLVNLATNTTANGAASIVTKSKVRILSGRSNLIGMAARFGDTGTANNVREMGLYIDSNNAALFRLSGTTFQIVIRKGGVETVINNGSFNGNGLSSSISYTVDTNFHDFIINYTNTDFLFIIDNTPIHFIRATSTSLTQTVLGQLYVSNANSGGSTTAVDLNLLAVSGNYIGDAINNPNYYNIDATAETRTLKAGGGTLQSITIGRLGGANALLTVYDNTAGSGTKIITLDLTANSAFGTHVMGIEGVNFNTGLTYVTSGTMTNASVTFFWD